MAYVALFARAWIEIKILSHEAFKTCVALFARAWIEISPATASADTVTSRPLCEGVD